MEAVGRPALVAGVPRGDGVVDVGREDAAVLPVNADLRRADGAFGEASAFGDDSLTEAAFGDEGLGESATSGVSSTCALEDSSTFTSTSDVALGDSSFLGDASALSSALGEVASGLNLYFFGHFLTN